MYNGIPGLVHYSQVNNGEQKKEAQKIVDTVPTVDDVFINPRSGFFTSYEKIGIAFNGPLRANLPGCSKKFLKTHPKRCTPIKGAGVSRRCPNTDRVKL